MIDLDETIYPASIGIWPAFRERMDQYMEEKLGLAPELIPALRERLFQTYGSTLYGLQVEYTVDADDYQDYIHAVELEKFLSPDPLLLSALEEIPQEKYIFTNASRGHAERVLELTGLRNCFKGIIDFSDIVPYCKPNSEAFQIAMRIIGEDDPAAILLIDDMVPNLISARNLGWSVLLVAEKPIENLPQIRTLADAATFPFG